MYSLFALSARFSSSPSFAGVPPLQRSSRFIAQAKQYYDELLALNSPNLTYLQGCILLAFCLYTSEPSAQAWILIGVCVRIAYDLGLSEMDEESSEKTTVCSWVRREEMRRAWWAVWELDTFGSSIYRRPFSIDRRRMSVKLPVSDEAWFAGTEMPSARLLTRPGHCWKSLQGCENSDERAWFLVANHLMSVALDLSQQREGVSPAEEQALDNDISCLKLSLPTAFRIEMEGLTFDSATFAKSNWIIGTHLMILSATFASTVMVITDKHGLLVSQNSNHLGNARMRAFELSKIVSRWSAEYVPFAHPFLACFCPAPLS